MKRPNPTGWLWWLALLIAAAASGVVYSLRQDVGNINAQQTISTVILFAVVGIGICIISATAHWWLNR